MNITPMTPLTNEATTGTEHLSPSLVAVLNERRRQDAKWDVQNHDPFTYLTILGEEFGEMCQAALTLRQMDALGDIDSIASAADHLREEAVQTAAVALAIIECLDRNQWRWDLAFDSGAAFMNDTLTQFVAKGPDDHYYVTDVEDIHVFKRWKADTNCLPPYSLRHFAACPCGTDHSVELP